MILSISALLSNAACTKIQVPDVEACADLGSLGANCFTTLSNKERDITKEQWDTDRVGQLCLSGESFGKLKETILKFCKANSKICVYEKIEKQVNELDEKVQRSRRKRHK